MSCILYIASNNPLPLRENPHEKLLSVREALALGITDLPDCLLAEDFDKDKPDVVLYEEALDGDTVDCAVRALSAADLVIVGGTSLVVYPAAGLLDYTRAPVVLINKSATAYDGRAALVIARPIGEVLSRITVR